jgi:hypothetical protein
MREKRVGPNLPKTASMLECIPSYALGRLVCHRADHRSQKPVAGKEVVLLLKHRVEMLTHA